MCARGWKGWVRVSEVSLGLLPVLPSSFQGSLGPPESQQNNPGGAQLEESRQVGPSPGPAARLSGLGQSRGDFSKDTEQTLCDSQGSVCSDSNRSSQAGAGGGRQGSPKLPRSKFSILGLGVSTPAAFCTQSPAWTCLRKLPDSLSSWRKDFCAGQLAAASSAATPSVALNKCAAGVNRTCSTLPHAAQLSAGAPPASLDSFLGKQAF